MKSIKIQTSLAIALITVTSTSAYSCPPNAVQPLSIKQQVDEVVSHLVGVMDTSAQASSNPKAPNVRMTTCKVTVETPTPSTASFQPVFLYQEQALQQHLSQPYRQRFLRISANSDVQKVESAGFKPPNPQAWVGLCNQPEVKRVVQLSDIGKTECSVFLRPDGNNYIGETQASGCPTNYKGAVRITNRIILHQTGMDTMDRGFDAAGNLVWGAKEAPYQYRWVHASTPSQ
jgi:hypothetical protein